MAHTILIADDEPELLRNYTDILGTVPDLTIITAKDGLDAYQKARKQKFDLIITDMRMPKIDGAQLIIALREQRFNMSTPIFVVSGYPEEIKVECAKMSQVSFYAKPVDLNILTAAVVTQLEQKQEQKSATVDVRVINAVIDATITVLKNFGGCKDIKNSPPRLLNTKEPPPKVNISGAIFVNSPKFCGEIVVSFEEAVFVKITNYILGESHTKISSENNDAAGEIANIIFGQAKQKLSELQIAVSDARFRVIQQTFLETIENLGSPTLFIPFESNIGPFYVTVCFQPLGNPVGATKTSSGMPAKAS
jgi:chemotaxis protein CheX